MRACLHPAVPAAALTPWDGRREWPLAMRPVRDAGTFFGGWPVASTRLSWSMGWAAGGGYPATGFPVGPVPVRGAEGP